MRLNNLCLPFCVEVGCRRGSWWLHGVSRSIVLKAGQVARVMAHRRFAMEAGWTGSMTGGNAIHLALGTMKSARRDAAESPAVAVWVVPPARPLTLEVAKAVFSRPEAPWSRAHTAALLNISPGALSARMLREGVALTDLVCEQRLMRVLYEISHGKQMRATFGFASRERRDTAFFDRFGMCLDQFAAMNRAGIVSWSAGEQGHHLPL